MCSNGTGLTGALSAKDLGKSLRKFISTGGVSRGPTLYLYMVLVTLIAVFTAAYWMGVMGWATTWLILVPAYYFIAICVHDAVHRSAHSHPKLNGLVGWTGAALHGLSYATLRRQHLYHHSHLGHESDDERYVYRSAWTLPLRLLTVHLFCYAAFVKAPKSERWQGLGLLACFGLGVACFPSELLWGWWLPMLISNAAFAWTSVYLPHGPLGPWVDRNMPQLTGYHHEHHAVPQLPWYQVASVARKRRWLEAKLEDAGLSDSII